MDTSSHSEVLRVNHIRLVGELNIKHFFHHLEPCFGKFFADLIAETNETKDQNRKLIHYLKTGPIEKFDTFCKVIAGLYPSLFKLLKNRNPTEEETDFFLRPFRDELVQSILNTGNKPDNDIDERIDLDTQFVSLRLSGTSTGHSDMLSRNVDADTTLPDIYQQYLEQVEKDDLEIDEILPHHSSGGTTLIKGRAGVGKSTLVQLLIRTWAKGKWASAYKCMFLLNLTKLVHVHQKVTLTELLGTYSEYVIDRPDQDQPSLQWLINNAKDVLFFTDGIDELPELGALLRRTPKLKKLSEDMTATPLDWCLNLLQNNFLAQSSKVMVNRPFAGLSKLPHNRVIDVLGLTSEKVMVFVEKNVQADRQGMVRDILSKEPVLLSVCSITFYCAAICKVLEVDCDINTEFLTTYSRITAYIITRLAKRHIPGDAAASVFSDDMYKCLSDLASLAYQGLSETQGHSEVLRVIQLS